MTYRRYDRQKRPQYKVQSTNAWFQYPDLKESPPSRTPRSKIAGRPEIGVSGILDVKVSSNVLHTLMTEVELKEIDQSILHISLCDIQPDLMSYEAAISIRCREVWERAMLTELQEPRTSNTFAEAEKPLLARLSEPNGHLTVKADQVGYTVKAKAGRVAKCHGQIGFGLRQSPLLHQRCRLGADGSCMLA